MKNVHRLEGGKHDLSDPLRQQFVDGDFNISSIQDIFCVLPSFIDYNFVCAL